MRVDNSLCLLQFMNSCKHVYISRCSLIYEEEKKPPLMMLVQ